MVSSSQTTIFFIFLRIAAASASVSGLIVEGKATTADLMVEARGATTPQPLKVDLSSAGGEAIYNPRTINIE